MLALVLVLELAVVMVAKLALVLVWVWVRAVVRTVVRAVVRAVLRSVLMPVLVCVLVPAPTPVLFRPVSHAFGTSVSLQGWQVLQYTGQARLNAGPALVCEHSSMCESEHTVGSSLPLQDKSVPLSAPVLDELAGPALRVVVLIEVGVVACSASKRKYA